MKQKTYKGAQIKVLDGLEPVRLRPGMYIGNTSHQGLHHLVYEILDNAVDEHLADACDTIIIDLYKDSIISIRDNGRGLPVDLMPNTKDYPKELYSKGISSERVVLTTLHAGGKFTEDDGYPVSGGLHGVGVSVVNALSVYLKVEVWKDGYYYVDEYKNGGMPITKLDDGELLPISKTKETGTCITFKPDDSIFDTIKFKPAILKKRFHELAFLNKGLKFIFNDHTGEKVESITYYEEKGIEGYVAFLNKDKTSIHEPIFVHSIDGKIDVEVAFQFTTEEGETIYSFCNNINTVEGGTHVTGFKASLTKMINKYAKDLNMFKGEGSLEGKDVRSGLVAIISIKHKNPQFEGQTKTKLGNSDAKSAVESVFSRETEVFFDRNIKIVTTIIENALKAYNLRKAEAKTKECLLNKAAQIQPPKLADCQLKNNPAEGIFTEIYLVEGDSAGGSAKQGRKREFQAILPLKGKILNIEKSSITKLLENDEIISLINSFGCGFCEGFGNDFDIKKLKYHKIIIMTDADVDGAHIRTLLLTFFYRFYRELIEQGHIYIAQPPLYKISVKTAKKDKSAYVFSDKELQSYIKDNKLKNPTIQRFKGLGEMNPEQLWETTMDPETRTLLQVTIEDAIAADEITQILMGTNTDDRRCFIEEESINATINI